MYICYHCEVSCQNRTSFNKHLRVHLNTDVKFLTSQVKSVQDNAIKQEELAVSFKTERCLDNQFENITVKDEVNAKFKKKGSKKGMDINKRSMSKVISDDVEVKKCKKEVPPSDVSFGKKNEAMSITNFGIDASPDTVFKKGCNDSSSNQDMTKSKNLSNVDLHLKIKEERGIRINKFGVKEQSLKD